MKERDEQVRAVQKRKKEILEQEKIVRQIKNQMRRLRAEQTRRANLYARKTLVDHLGMSGIEFSCVREL